MKYKLHTSKDNRKLGGLCYGIAESIEADVTVVRVISFLLCVFQPIFILVYFVLCVLLPDDKGDILDSYVQDKTESEKAGGLFDNYPDTKLGLLAGVLITGLVLVVMLDSLGVIPDIKKVYGAVMMIAGIITIGYGVFDRNSSGKKKKLTVGSIVTLTGLDNIIRIFGIDSVSNIRGTFLFRAFNSTWPLFILSVILSFMFPKKNITGISWAVSVMIFVVVCVLILLGISISI